jgi:uncharacterized alkaline shock family protein YloU
MDESKKTDSPEDPILDLGVVRIADEVIASIAGIAAMDTVGVVGMSSGLIGGMAELIGKKNPAKGVKVQVGAREVAVDVYIIVEYGLRIPDVALQVQEKIKEAIETATGMSVVEVNVHVQGVGFSQGDTDEELKVR